MSKHNSFISGVYCIENLFNGKKYIGQTKNLCQRGSFHLALLQAGRHHCSDMQEDYDKYGIKNFVYRVLWVCSGSSLFLKENEYIKKFNSVENGYNSTYGGETGCKFINSFPRDIQKSIASIKKDNHNIRLSKEKNFLNKVLLSYVGIKMYTKSKEQNEFKEKFFNCLLTPKKTNHRKRGIRSMQRIIEEDSLPYKIISKQDRKRIKYKNETYWLISKK